MVGAVQFWVVLRSRAAGNSLESPMSKICQVTGKKPTKVRWVDVNKGDAESPNVRSRIVAKDFKVDARPDLFAATPPLEYLRYLVSRCASSQLGRPGSKL